MDYLRVRCVICGSGVSGFARKQKVPTCSQVCKDARDFKSSREDEISDAIKVIFSPPVKHGYSKSLCNARRANKRAPIL